MQDYIKHQTNNKVIISHLICVITFRLSKRLYPYPKFQRAKEANIGKAPNLKEDTTK